MPHALVSFQEGYKSVGQQAPTIKKPDPTYSLSRFSGSTSSSSSSSSLYSSRYTISE